jgi:hypothetical protein
VLHLVHLHRGLFLLAHNTLLALSFHILDDRRL